MTQICVYVLYAFFCDELKKTLIINVVTSEVTYNCYIYNKSCVTKHQIIQFIIIF